mgnify:FL=1
MRIPDVIEYVMWCAVRIDNLARNVAHFRKGLENLGFEVIGDDDSPVVPVMIYIPTQMPALARMALEKNVR